MKNKMPLNFTLKIEIFDVWRIDIMGPYPSLRSNKYILVVVDCLTKWKEAIANPSSDSRVVAKLFKKIIFPFFRVPRVFISDNVMHFIEDKLGALLKKYGVHHKLGLATIIKLVAKSRSQTVRLSLA